MTHRLPVLALSLWMTASPAAATPQAQPPKTQTAPQAQPARPQAQTPPQAAPQQARPAPQAAQAVPAAPRAAARPAIVLTVTDMLGVSVADAHVTMSGPVSREGTTAGDGGLRFQALKTGTYRLRFEARGFITLERELTLGASGGSPVDIALNRAPKPPEVVTASAPPPPPPPAQPARVAPDPNATTELLVLPDWIEKNLVGRTEPQKESTVGRTPGVTATVLQVRSPMEDRTHPEADEMLYVIAGQGVLVVKGREQALDAGSFVVVPRGITYSLERRGRNPLIALSVIGK